MSEKDPVSVAQSIFETIQMHASAAPRNSTDIVNLESSDGTLLLAGHSGLYSGRLGIALFTAALEKVSGTEYCDGWTKRTVAHLFNSPPAEVVSEMSLGVGTGLGSLVYGLSVLTTITGSQRYARLAEDFIEALSARKIEMADTPDVVNGLAGLIHGSLRLYEQTNHEQSLTVAHRCGMRLLEIQVQKWGYSVWDTHPSDNINSFTTGFAHGAAGISSALRRLAGQDHRQKFTLAAANAHGFEEVFYSSIERNWKANWTAQPDYPIRWCFGAPGIGLARLSSLLHLPADDPATNLIERDLVRVEQRSWSANELDTLCDGTAAVVDLLIELSRYRDVATRRTDELIEHLLNGRDRRGHFRVPFAEYGPIVNVSLFNGLAGIGYTLLRSISPEVLPSLLRLE